MNAVLETTRSAADSLGAKPAHWLQVVSHLDPRYGGLSSAVPALADRLAGKGVEVSVAAFCAPGEHYRPADIAPRRLSYWPAGRKPWLSAGVRQGFRSQLRKADGVHIHGLWEQSTLMAARGARRLDIPYILSAHGMLEPWALASKRRKKQVYAALFERKNVERAACLHALTQAEAAHYVRFGARSPIAVIPNGISVPPNASADAFLERYPALRGRRIILFMARLHPKKGLDLLIEAWSRLAAQNPDAHLVIAGADFEGTQAAVEAQIAQHHLSSSVLFTGMLDSTMKWSALAAAEGFVLPSRSEGLSVGVLEAMGMGLPVIVTEPCNMPEVLEHRAGWEIQPEAGELTAALEHMLGNTPQRNKQIGSRGSALVRSQFSWQTVSRQMADLYQWVLGGPLPQTVPFVHP